jgi:hypothetical protein
LFIYFISQARIGEMLERFHVRVIQQVELSEEELQVLAGVAAEEAQRARH